MKVLLLNGSPHKKGNTYIALNEVAKTLEENGVETEIVYLGTKPLQGCIACGRCRQLGKCVFNDEVNEVLEKMELSAHIAQNTARLNPRDLEQMVRDFAQPYFTHIQNVGWWGAVFALPGTIINLLL